MKKSILGSMLGLVVAVVCFLILHLAFDQTSAFRAQAELGQPIVRAIEDFHGQSGVYPSSLTDLAPKYLATVSGIPNESQHKFIGWEYRMVTNGMAVTCTLRHSMGKGGVEYEPPDWFRNDEGTRIVVLSNR